MDLKRGDNRTIYVNVSASIAPEGSTMYFMAKPQPDDDMGDTNAVISVNSTERVVVHTDKGDYARFTINLAPTDTNHIEFGDKKVISLYSEFEVRTLDGKVYSLPGSNKYIRTKVYADVRRGGA
jgi:hypothetical protein